jgi:death-on-curing protein
VGDPGLLASAVARPQASFDGEDLYPDLSTKATALAQSVIKSWSFVGGNRRTAVTATRILLELNGQRPTASNHELRPFAVKMAPRRAALEQIAPWLKAHSSKA